MAPFDLNSITSTNIPTDVTSNIPSNAPSGIPSSVTSGAPSSVTSGVPTSVPSTIPTSVSSTVLQGPSTNMTSYTSSNDNTEQQLKDIVTLQNIEKELFETLETNSNLTNEEYDKIIKKIDSISQMRINLYNTLGGINDFYKDSMVDSQETLKQQLFAIKIVEEQLNEAKKKIRYLKLKQNNKIRLIEISDYYGERYNEHTILMKYIIFMLVPIIILSYLFNRGFIHSFIFYMLLIFITVLGSIFIVNRLISIWSRDNMYYQEYSWKFNAKNAPKPNSDNSSTNPWLLQSGSLFGTCIGNSCCSEKTMIYDESLNKCVVQPSNA